MRREKRSRFPEGEGERSRSGRAARRSVSPPLPVAPGAGGREGGGGWGASGGPSQEPAGGRRAPGPVPRGNSSPEVPGLGVRFWAGGRRARGAGPAAQLRGVIYLQLCPPRRGRRGGVSEPVTGARPAGGEAQNPPPAPTRLPVPCSAAPGAKGRPPQQRREGCLPPLCRARGVPAAFR